MGLESLTPDERASLIRNDVWLRNNHDSLMEDYGKGVKATLEEVQLYPAKDGVYARLTFSNGNILEFTVPLDETEITIIPEIMIGTPPQE